MGCVHLEKEQTFLFVEKKKVNNDAGKTKETL